MKKTIITIIISALVFTTVGVYATITYSSKDIKFAPSKEEWNVDNLEDAVNELYSDASNDMKVDLLWERNSSEKTFNSQKVKIDLSNYEVVFVYAVSVNNNAYGYSYARIGEVSETSIGYGYGSWFRTYTVSSDGIQFADCYGNGVNQYSTRNTEALPTKIYGVKKAIDFN